MPLKKKNIEDSQHLDIQIFSVTGGVGARPNMYSVGGGRVRQMFEQRRSAASPVGWDKSYPLDPVEAVNNEVRTPLYKQNVSRKEMKIVFFEFQTTRTKDYLNV